jgi:hypothetical protein
MKAYGEKRGDRSEMQVDGGRLGENFDVVLSSTDQAKVVAYALVMTCFKLNLCPMKAEVRSPNTTLTLTLR